MIFSKGPPEEVFPDLVREVLQWQLAEAKEAAKALTQAAADAPLTVELLVEELAAADAEAAELRRHRTAPPPPAPE